MKYVFWCLALALTGCTATYETNRPYAGAPSGKQAREGSAYIALSKPGRVGDKEYPESGRMTSQVIQSELSKYLASTKLGESPEGYDAALASARQNNSRYLVLPEVKHWEDRATEWSGIPDRILVRLDVINAATGDFIDTVEISAKSKWGTLGGDHPQELLKKPIGDFFASLFAK